MQSFHPSMKNQNHQRGMAGGDGNCTGQGMRKRIGGLDGSQAEHEPQVVLLPKSKSRLKLRQQKYNAKIKQNGGASLFCVNQTIPRRLCPVLGTTFRTETDKLECVPEESQQDDKRPGRKDLQGTGGGLCQVCLAWRKGVGRERHGSHFQINGSGRKTGEETMVFIHQEADFGQTWGKSPLPRPVASPARGIQERREWPLRQMLKGVDPA